MTSGGLIEMFEGDMRRKISAGVDGGPSGGSRVRRPGSKDPHRRQRKLKQFSTYFDLIGDKG